MTAEIISGKDIAQQIINDELQPRVELLNKKGVQPKLVVIFVGDNPASQSYIRQKEKFATQSGVFSEVRRFPDTMTEAELLAEIDDINNDDSIHGVIVQLPLPDGIDVNRVINAISPTKDVDGFTDSNNENLDIHEAFLAPCTPKGIITLLDKTRVTIKDQKVVVMGRSRIVGRPVAEMLKFRGANVTILHSKSTNTEKSSALKKADILIVAVGKQELVHGEELSPGVVIIDVGIHRKEDGKLCGDVHFDSCSSIASKITPVPGGVGPMTVVTLISNTIKAAEEKNKV
ncbi:bifunctional 5,10-methylenetetrahydrofolate dehydrogenase/5,10-methenyltetrahydrofolate cyclohydrolase [Candidatus Gracilibacteria bacterium]|nr:bifunctional 5,10-methylenetetrahydrofolate dehydrogenase/5,10-methenyltetrahydrofolate cyclohydrolase [Candidatus Gracilibacteria bacterium]